ncbi:MAG: HNH endonuclease [Chloroflexi bacterium]|nr:HNH endonuclease [Chloroflexota bacterium]
MINSQVLVLNQNYEPLNVCRVRRAVVLVWQGKAEVLENGRGEIRGISLSLTIPSVIRLFHLIRRPRPQRRLTRRDIFLRDGYTCQYCGRKGRELTLDHVIPRHRGGSHDWGNVVSACKECNHRKAGRTPEQAGMKMLNHPTHPRYLGFVLFYSCPDDQWLKYLPQLEHIYQR